MLQQTQVATVIPFFQHFMAEFPTIASLAAAPQQRVLRLWQGLGYYSRARNLQAAAQRIVADHNGQIPPDPAALLNLPGVGRYTAGAIASLAFGLRQPILDGNVARVLCRLEKIQSNPRDRDTQSRLWQLAEEILPKRRVADFNSALMELGATLCTPRNPQCNICPVQRCCKAFAANLQDKIPIPKPARPVAVHHRWTFAAHHKDRWLIEQRPQRGRWASLWQFVTIEATNGKADVKIASAAVGGAVANLTPLSPVRHALTHRKYLFTPFLCTVSNDDNNPPTASRKWVRSKDLTRYPFSKPQLIIAHLAAAALQSQSL